MLHSNAREAASTVPVRLGWLHVTFNGLELILFRYEDGQDSPSSVFVFANRFA